MTNIRIELSNLPALTGSEKQIAWATDIRATAAGQIANSLSPAVAKGQATEEQIAQVVVLALSERTESKWWIDNRSGVVGHILLKDIGQERYLAILAEAGIQR